MVGCTHLIINLALFILRTEKVLRKRKQSEKALSVKQSVWIELPSFDNTINWILAIIKSLGSSI